MESEKELYKQIIIFLGIVSAITTGIYLWMFNGAEKNVTAILLMMWTPGISAILTSFICKIEIKGFGWRLGKASYLGYSYLMPIVVSLVAYGSVWIFGLADFTSVNVLKWAKMIGFEVPAPFLVGLFGKMIFDSIATVIPALGEEIGWSGFLTPRLLKLFSIPVTSLIVGGYFAIWHFGAIIGGLYGSGTPLWASLSGFTLVAIGFTFLKTVLILRSGSLWTGVMMHISHNVILMVIFFKMTVNSGYAAYLVSETGVYLGVVYIIVAVLFWRYFIKNEAVSKYAY